MVVRPSTVSEKWESSGSWVLSSSCCRSLAGDHRSSLGQTKGWNKGGSRKTKQSNTENLERIWRRGHGEEQVSSALQQGLNPGEG